MNIILSPHLDDAALSCWYILSQPDALVVNVFAGLPPEHTAAWWDRLCGEKDSRLMMQKRLKENEAAISLSTTGQQVFLPYLDAQYRTKGAQLLVKELTDRLIKEAPQQSVFYAPLAASRLFQHPDHVLVRQIGLELTKRGQRVHFYPDYPYMGLGRGAGYLSSKSLQKRAERVVGHSLQAQLNKLTASQLSNKRQALLCYKTQYLPLNIMTLGTISRIASRPYELTFSPTTA